ncbi:MAG: hypothetical protein BWY57_02141 [Betaproteobacteria bacterium ADurb.Bin341]|nr:MAG: hypothetical protein BWY57_02141 [Betaproteobacteria bacterium ADurb.Bin341]
MKRDMDLVRRIILATTELPYGETLNELEGVSQEEFAMHAIWLQEAGLIDAIAQAGSGSSAKFAIISRLTWDGCEFADAIASDTLWNKAKENVFKPGISFTFDILKDWLKAEIVQGFPTLVKLA